MPPPMIIIFLLISVARCMGRGSTVLEVLIRKVEVLLPIIVVDFVLSVADMVANRAHYGMIYIGHFGKV